MRTACLFVCAGLGLGACSFNPSGGIPGIGGDAPGEPDAGGSNLPALRKAITITGSVAGLSADLEGVAIAVIVPVDADLREEAQADGNDIVFTGVNGVSVLPHEIETFDKSTGRLVAWVKVPQVTAAGTTRIFMYYGVNAAQNHEEADEVWADGFAGVWHMTSEDAGGSTKTYRDSTKAGNDGTADGGGRPGDLVDGLVGPAQDYDGSNDSVAIADPADGGLDFGTGSFSWSAWVQVTQSSGGSDRPWNKGDDLVGPAGDPGYELALGTGRWLARISDGASFIEVEYGQEVDDFLGQRVHLVAVVDRDSNSFHGYVNGTRIDSTGDLSTLGSLDNDKPALLGATDQPFQGVLDEVRVYSEVLSEDRVKLDLANINMSDTLVAVGPQEDGFFPIVDP